MWGKANSNRHRQGGRGKGRGGRGDRGRGERRKGTEGDGVGGTQGKGREWWSVGMRMDIFND